MCSRMPGGERCEGRRCWTGTTKAFEWEIEPVVLHLDDEPSFVTPSERALWELLQQQLGADDLLGANVRVTRNGQDREVDLLVGLADGGIVVLEVKGGPVWIDNRRWLQKRRG